MFDSMMHISSIKPLSPSYYHFRISYLNPPSRHVQIYVLYADMQRKYVFFPDLKMPPEFLLNLNYFFVLLEPGQLKNFISMQILAILTVLVAFL